MRRQKFIKYVKNLIPTPTAPEDKCRYEQSHSESVKIVMWEALSAIDTCLKRRFGAFKAKFLALPPCLPQLISLKVALGTSNNF
jgi:hypothetical protein